MTSQRYINSRLILFMLTTFLLLMFIACSGYAANYPLEIIQPRAGLDTKNRFYKAYPGLEYNVRAAVIGGAYPFAYELTTHPSGMKIDPNTGEITWPNPTTSGSPHTVTLRVLDQEGVQKSVTWAITVTTSGFRFIDAVNGTPAESGGTGTISNPWKSIRDMYEGNDYASKTKNRYSGEFLYFRNGTYRMDGYIENGARMPLVLNAKPQVWLAYPGETPKLEFNYQLIIYAGGDNTYFDGFEMDQMGNGQGFKIDGAVDNVTFRRNTSHNLDNGVPGANPSMIFISSGGNNSKYWSFQDNIGYDATGTAYWLLGYDADKVLVEDNEIYNFSGHLIGPKVDCEQWFIRHNYIHDSTGEGIELLYATVDSGANFGDMEISYNFVDMPSGTALYLNHEAWNTGLPVYVYRNTFIGGVTMRRVTSTNGPWHIKNNVIINNTSGDKINDFEIYDPSRLITTENLGGTATDNIVDANGNLTSEYSSYIGTHGYQVGDSSTSSPITLSPPTGLKIISTK